MAFFIGWSDTPCARCVQACVLREGRDIYSHVLVERLEQAARAGQQMRVGGDVSLHRPGRVQRDVTKHS